MEGSYGFLSCVPMLVLVVGCIVTKKMIEFFVIAGVVGAVILHKGDFFAGWMGLLYEALMSESLAFFLILVVGFGIIIHLLKISGAMMGFQKIVVKVASTQKKSLLITWVLGIIIFVDDYLNNLAIAACMRGTTDRLKIPREHLAYTVNAMGANICVMIPFSTWAAAMIATLNGEGLVLGDYVKAIPFMFYPIISCLICLLVIIGIIPKVGALKKAYERVERTGEVLPSGEEVTDQMFKVDVDDGNGPVSSPLNFIIPMAVMVGIVLVTSDMASAIIVTIVVQLVLYIPQGLIKLNDAINQLYAGVESMAAFAFAIVLCYILSFENTDLGFQDYMISVFEKFISPAFIPAIAFVLVGCIAFATSSFFGQLVIMPPIFIPLCLSAGIPPALAIAAIMSGVAFGSHFCFYSDAIFMTAAATNVPNMTQIRVTAPYILTAVGIALIGFIAAGFIAMG